MLDCEINFILKKTNTLKILMNTIKTQEHRYDKEFINTIALIQKITTNTDR